ncbi:MAG: RNA polymerase sigma factor [Myxococcales bacterium]|nr:RNA polymerase sigma factor [Myxococcales bacterium]
MDDDDIRAGLRDGDVDGAFRLLRARHGGPVFRACLARLRDPTLAEEAMQDAFVNAFRKRRQLAAADSVRGYLLGIAGNVAVDMLRKAQRRTRLARANQVVADEERTPPGTPADAEPAAVAALYDCLDQLEPGTRTAVFMHYRDARPWQEIATAIGVPVDTVRMRVKRVLKDLRACLKAKGVTA